MSEIKVLWRSSTEKASQERMILQGVAEAECRRAADLAEEAYRAAWDEPYSSKEKDLDQQHQICLRAANQAYDAHALGTPLRHTPVCTGCLEPTPARSASPDRPGTARHNYKSTTSEQRVLYGAWGRDDDGCKRACRRQCSEAGERAHLHGSPERILQQIQAGAHDACRLGVPQDDNHHHPEADSGVAPPPSKIQASFHCQ